MFNALSNEYCTPENDDISRFTEKVKTPYRFDLDLTEVLHLRDSIKYRVGVLVAAETFLKNNRQLPNAEITRKMCLVFEKIESYFVIGTHKWLKTPEVAS